MKSYDLHILQFSNFNKKQIYSIFEWIEDTFYVKLSIQFS